MSVGTQLQSYGFTNIENPLSDSGNFSQMTGNGVGALKVPSSGICEQAQASGVNSDMFWSGSAFPNDQYSEVTVAFLLSGATSLVGVSLRATATTGYFFLVGGNTATPTQYTSGALYKLVGAAFTQIGSNFNITISANDILRGVVSGTTLTLFQNGVQRTQFTDSTYSSGSPGIHQYGAVAADSQISFWAAGSATLNTPSITFGSGNATITSTDTGVAFTYTTDGTTPVPGSHGTTYTTPFSVNSGKTVKAVSSLSGYTNSAVGSATAPGSGGSSSSWMTVNADNVLRGLKH